MTRDQFTELQEVNRQLNIAEQRYKEALQAHRFVILDVVKKYVKVHDLTVREIFPNLMISDLEKEIKKEQCSFNSSLKVKKQVAKKERKPYYESGEIEFFLNECINKIGVLKQAVIDSNKITLPAGLEGHTVSILIMPDFKVCITYKAIYDIIQTRDLFLVEKPFLVSHHRLTKNEVSFSLVSDCAYKIQSKEGAMLAINWLDGILPKVKISLENFLDKLIETKEKEKS